MRARVREFRELTRLYGYTQAKDLDPVGAFLDFAQATIFPIVIAVLVILVGCSLVFVAFEATRR